MCNNCGEKPKTFGCFCGKCLANVKKDKKKQKKNEAFWKAMKFGSGDLWRGNI